MDHKFIRDADNPGAVINTDKEGLTKYKAEKAKSAKLKEMEKRIDNMESMLSEILKHVKG